MIVLCEKCDTPFGVDTERLESGHASACCEHCGHVFAIEPDSPGGTTDPDGNISDSLLQTWENHSEMSGDPESEFAARLFASDPVAVAEEPETPGVSTAGELPDTRAPGASSDPSDIGHWEFDHDQPFLSGPEDEDALTSQAEPEIEETWWDEADSGDGEAASGGNQASPIRGAAGGAASALVDAAIPDSPPTAVVEPVPTPQAGGDLRPSGDTEPVHAPHPAPVVETSSGASAAPREAVGAASPANAPIYRTPVEVRRTASWWLVRAAGWGATLVLVATVLISGLSPRGGAETVPARLTLGALQAQDLRGRWIENAPGRVLLVVSGTLTNSGNEAVPGVQLRVSLLDQRGRRIPGASATAGPALALDRIRNEEPEALIGRLESGAARMAQPIGPGHQVAFDALFPEVPDQARRFTLETVEAAQENPAAPRPGPVRGS